MTERLGIIVDNSIVRMRLEDYLFDKFPNLSRSYIRRIIRDGHCEVNGRCENRGYRIRGRDFIEIEIDASRETAMRPEAIPLDIIFEDSEILVLDKPAGMLVHPTNFQRSGTLLNAAAHHLRRAGQPHFAARPGLVHRLDQQTSGVIVIAKNLRSHRILARQFARKSVEKHYVAVVEGVVQTDAGRIEAPIGRFAEDRFWGVKLDGKPSVTEYSVIESGPSRTLVQILCLTGRTNQIRIHLAHIGHPILGDDMRGGGRAERLFLHAVKLSLRHPSTGQLVEFESPLPPEFRHAVKS